MFELNNDGVFEVDDPGQFLGVLHTYDPEAAVRVADAWGAMLATTASPAARAMVENALNLVQSQRIFVLCDECDWPLIDTDEDVHEGWCAIQVEIREAKAQDNYVSVCRVCGEDSDICQGMCTPEQVAQDAQQETEGARGEYELGVKLGFLN